MAFDELIFEDHKSTRLIVRTDGESMSWLEDDGVPLTIVWEESRDESPVASLWMHLAPAQAVELARAILGRWGD